MNNTLFPEIENSGQTQQSDEEELLQHDFETNEPEYDMELPDDGQYEFATGDLSSFIHDFEEDKEQMGIEQKPTTEEFTEAGKRVIPTQTALKTGRFLANMVDYSCATGLSLISGLDVDEHRADKESKSELETIITEYVKESGGEIPIWMQLLICLVVTYGLQIPGAIRIRNERKQNEYIVNKA